jgi:AraC family transcriptional regulator
MDYKEHIAKAVEYIEQNLTNEINLVACAKVCGYSEYHFLRVFKEVSGLTPADRRALCLISNTKYYSSRIC